MNIYDISPLVTLWYRMAANVTMKETLL